MLEINMLGPPSVKWNNSMLKISRRQVRALLYCLAVRPQVIPREKLCFLFWPNIPDSRARRHLSHLISHLRNALPEGNLLQVNKNHVGLDPEQTWSDTNTLEQLYTLGGKEAKQQAVDLYRGHFLSGFSLPGCAEFESWAADEGYHFENYYLGILSSLMEEEANTGNYESAIALAQRYLALDNLAEGVHRKLIDLYRIVGKRNAAIEQFERCTVVLERELGVSPMPATRALYEAVLKNERPLSFRPEIQSTLKFLSGLQVPLVGRQLELQRLEQIWEKSTRGKTSVVFISGEAGIGKSRLLNAFVDGHINDTLIITSSCHPMKRPIPYQPLVEALAPVVSSIDHKHPNRENAQNNSTFPFSLSKTWLAEVSRLLPDLRTLYPGLPVPLPAKSDEARGRLFEAITRLLLDLVSKPLPMLLIFDDLHWADRATLDWLVFFGHYLDNLHKKKQFGKEMPCCLILIAYRKEEEKTLVELRRSLANTIGFVDIELDGLRSDAVIQLVENLVSASSFVGEFDNQQLSNRLQSVAGNNPFFLIETMRTLLEKGLILRDLDDLTPIPMTDSLRVAVDQRMQNLTSQATQVLEACAVLNGVFDFDLVQLTAGRDELETVEGLEELTARQFFVEAEGGYKFRHDLIQQGVIARLAPVRRQLLHRRAGEALEKLHPEAVTNLAYHFEKGNKPKKAFHYYALSAQQAELVFAWEEAEEHQKHMLISLDQIDPQHKEQALNKQRAEILASRAHMRYLQGRIEDRDQDITSLEHLANSGTDELRLYAVIEKVRYLNLDSHFDEAIINAQKGLGLAIANEDQAAHARLQTQIGFAYYFLGQPKLALEALESALNVTQEDPDLMMRGRINHILGYVYFHLADYPRALSCQREAYRCHQQVGDQNRLAWDGLDIGLLHLKLGNLRDSKEYLDEHLALTRRISANPPKAYGLQVLGHWYLYQGDYVRGRDTYLESLKLQCALHSGSGRVAAEGALGLSLYHLGDLDQAQQRLESAANRAGSIANRRRLVEVLDMLGLVEIALGQFDKGYQNLQKAVGIARKSEFYEGLAFGLAVLARASRLLGEFDRAYSDAAEAVDVAKERDLQMSLLWARLEMGLIALAQGDFKHALAEIDLSMTLLPQAHQAWIGTEQVHFVYAKVLEGVDRFEDADQQLDKAETIIAQKADLITDPKQRQSYLSFTRGLLSSVILH